MELEQAVEQLSDISPEAVIGLLLIALLILILLHVSQMDADLSEFDGEQAVIKDLEALRSFESFQIKDAQDLIDKARSQSNTFKWALGVLEDEGYRLDVESYSDYQSRLKLLKELAEFVSKNKAQLSDIDLLAFNQAFEFINIMSTNE